MEWRVERKTRYKSIFCCLCANKLPEHLNGTLLKIILCRKYETSNLKCKLKKEQYTLNRLKLSNDVTSIH